MIIAIMANTFDNVIEKKTLYAIEMRLRILSEYKNVIDLVRRQKDYTNFIYYVYPIIDEEEQEAATEWEGGFNYLKRALNRKIEMLERSQIRNSQIVKIKQELMQSDLDIMIANHE